ncbi:Sterol desaturase/sphingolipid hydroxylase, fatty acid hydroxylase superfamily [Microbulbifer donghaiensis]|uniref:Sterol desaturase/sphingolipid hydroxylase, fatty acid hydroxylase superfamily n=1 Tax=Microbulbifer donghaiensis TaxID=494016 RepID=A0A1M5AGM3_9GAMM|nr:sterol desaturase family protein [Microbulbifer donghaiensis]SHF29052.1 Sterol desaturase/sphingolipid hydroxylase, fatty acid hydroxylase superfamily [Microbulbifer donghaiensis]
MNLITLAIPFFLIAVLVELALDRWRGWGLYRLNDAIGSLSAGILSRITGLVRKGVGLLIYIPLYQLLTPYYETVGFSWSAANPWHLLLAVVAYDFCYYWKHRFAHEINIFWADHLVHHQSEDYNLTTALRQPCGGLPIGWIFYLPLLLIGLPAELMITAGAIDLIYQFWVHTQKFPKVRWMEWIFVTPSNHRVHHAQNKVYVDRNYGGVFIIWDRLFGTYQEELKQEPCIYGVRKPLNNFDPLAANLQHYKRMALDAWYTKSWWDKFTLWFRRTGYRPADAEAAMPVPSCDLEHFERFDPQIGRGRRIYALLQHLIYSGGTLALLWYAQQLDYSQQLVAVALLALGLIANGRILNGHSWARVAELVRLAVLIAALPLLPATLSTSLVGYVAVSALTWWWLAFTDKEDTVALVSD